MQETTARGGRTSATIRGGTAELADRMLEARKMRVSGLFG
jgi:hypothetical protein